MRAGQDDSIPTAPLGDVESLVGGGNKILDSTHLLTVHRKAAAHCDWTERKLGRLKALPDPLRENQCSLLFAIQKHGQEFLAAESGRQIHRASVAFQNFPEELEHLVASYM